MLRRSQTSCLSAGNRQACCRCRGAPPRRGRWRPRRPSSGRAVADGVLVLLVPAGQHAGLHEVFAEYARVVVLHDEQVLVVVERRLVPERRIARAAPEDRMRRVLAVLLVVAGTPAGCRSLIWLFKSGVRPPRVDLDLVRRVRELQRVGRAVPDRLGQARDQRLARLVPVRVDGRERIVAPQVRWMLGALFFQLSCV